LFVFGPTAVAASASNSPRIFALPTGWASSSLGSISPPNDPKRRDGYEVSLQKKNAPVKLLIQTKFALNIAKIASLFAMAIQQPNQKTQACQYPY
jgi:hypothetical protein